MLFNSLGFLIFFPVVVIVHFLLPHKFRWIWLLAASYYFYMNWNASYAILILLSTGITYASGLLIYKSQKEKIKRLWITVSLVSNLSILFFYKYFNFFASTLVDLMHHFGVAMEVPKFEVLLPVGISFYIFQALSYTMDVYRKEIKPERNFGIYALFVSFFPQLVAGPIERSKNLLPQIRQVHHFDYDRVRSGALQMIWGYFKKLVIADRLAILVNTVFDNPAGYQGVEVFVAVFFFGIQIYCDFSGYTDIAIGAARIMGFDLMKNFRTPYFSKSIAEFWHRWHISLSSWFRDYLYIPLGGNRKGTSRTYINLFIVFLVSGLWHGANMTFVIWGGLHGLYIMFEKAYRPYQEKLYSKLKWDTRRFSFKLYRVLITFTLVSFAWIFFRANSLNDALVLIHNMSNWNMNAIFSGKLFALGLDSMDFTIAIISILLLLILDLYQEEINIPRFIFNQNIVFRWSIYLIAIFIILIFGAYGAEEQPFIYFQF